MAKTYQPRHRAGGGGRSFNGRKSIEDLYKTREWQAYRLRFLAHNPRCYNCGADSTVVDHLTPHLGDVALFVKLDNHIPLCETCHNRATALWDRKFVAGGSIRNKVEWMVWNRAAKELTFKVKVLPYYGGER